MSSIYRIKENMDEYTNNEKRIANYIIKNKEEVVASSVHLTAKKIKTSPAALVRFSQRLGYVGFSDLKVELAKDQSEKEESFDSLITPSDSLDVLVQKSKTANEITFKNTYSLLNMLDLKEAIKSVKKANKIYLFGLGGSGVVCEDLFQKLLRVNVDVIYNKDFHMQISALSNAKKGDVSIALSYSGETREIIVAQKIAHDKGMSTIAITQVGKSSLSKYSNYIFQIPKEETELRLGSISSRFSMLAITDLIYLGIAQSNAEVIREKIAKNRKIIKEFR